MYPIDEWRLYVHSRSTSQTYGASYALMSRMTTLEEWARTWNHCHPEVVGDPTRMLKANGLLVTSWSLFRDSVLPEWEHPCNANGTTLTHRTDTMRIDAAELWKQVVLDCVRGAAPNDVNGIQITQKYVRTVMYIRVDVWTRTNVNDTVMAWLAEVTPCQFVASMR